MKLNEFKKLKEATVTDFSDKLRQSEEGMYGATFIVTADFHPMISVATPQQKISVEQLVTIQPAMWADSAEISPTSDVPDYKPEARSGVESLANKKYEKEAQDTNVINTYMSVASKIHDPVFIRWNMPYAAAIVHDVGRAVLRPAIVSDNIKFAETVMPREWFNRCKAYLRRNGK